MSEQTIRDLGDEETLAAFNCKIHGKGQWDGKGLEDWTRDLIESKCPTVTPGDITIIESTSTGEIVSTCTLISQIWSNGGVPFLLK